MTATHTYRAYGLTLCCDRRIGLLPECAAAAPDVQIRMTGLPAFARDMTYDVSTANWSASQDRFYLQVDGIAEYLVLNGREIWVQPKPGVSDGDVDAFLVSSAIAALLQQRKLLTLHASAVSTERGAVLLVGRSGIGKSTTLAALDRRGYPMLTDDIAAINCDETISLVPSFPRMKVRGDALQAIGDTNTYTPVREDVEKFIVPAKNFDPVPQSIAHVFVLTLHPEPDVTVERLAFAEAFKWLAKYTFRQRFYQGLNLAEFHFSCLSRLVGSVPVAHVKRPASGFDLDGLVAALITELEHTAPDRSEAAG